MGATDFYVLSAEKTANLAFSGAHKQALEYYGNRGYTGSLAEKHSFISVTLPARVKLDDFIGWVSGYSDAPAKHEALVARATKIWGDKWGPALCIELVGKELVDAKARMGLKGTRKKVFCICGIAAE